MATSPVSSGGMIDVQSIVSQLMTVERQPLTLIDNNIKGIDTKLSEVGKLKAAMDKLRTAAGALSGLNSWKSSKAVSASPDSVDATAASGALPGSYSLMVNSLAQHQTIVTPAVADGNALVGGGSLTIQFGSGDGAAFAADATRPPVNIAIPAGATMSQVRDAINSSGAGIGASLVTDAAGTRLMLRSTDSGEKQAFSIAVADDGTGAGGLGLASLAYTPGDTGGGVERLQQAANANVELNGLPLSLASNTASDVIENVSFSFKNTTTAPVSVEIAPDGEALRSGIDAFVTAYNELNNLIKTQTAYNPATKTGGPLQGDHTVTTVQAKMREIIGATVSGATLARLSDAGIQVQRDGTLQVADDKLGLALADPKKLDVLFGQLDAADPTRVGIGKRLSTMLDDMLGTDGAITGATKTLQSRRDLYTEQEDRLNTRLTLIQARLVRQYSALDASLSQLSGSMNAVSQISTG